MKPYIFSGLLFLGMAGNGQEVQKFSHRGGRGLMPENTIIAMKNALDFRTNLEMDLYISKDGQVLVHHNSAISPVTASYPYGRPVGREEQASLKVFNLDYSTIRSFDIGKRYETELPRKKTVPAYIPLFAELIDSVESYVEKGGLTKPLYAPELKVPHGQLPDQYRERLTDAAVRIMQQKNILDRAIVQSFDVKTLEYLHKKYPHVKTSYLVLARQADYVSTLKLLSFKPTYYSPPGKVVTPELIAYCHKNDIKVITWTVNTIEEMEQLKKMGVDAIISDYPDFF
jgi:Glycerophosphoryl diester phosphodiesterase